jgi:hypothetical protein
VSRTDAKLGVFIVYGEFADGLKWPDGRLSYTYRNEIVVAETEEDALVLCERQFGDVDPEDGSASVSRVPLTRGVFGG